jgi:hypothetical protein
VDLHHNLFYGYRGPIINSTDRDRQLENNLTKALINTLWLGGKDVWRPFLAELGVRNTACAQFLLQRRDLSSRGAANKRRRVLLGISKRLTWKIRFSLAVMPRRGRKAATAKANRAQNSPSRHHWFVVAAGKFGYYSSASDTTRRLPTASA